MGTRLAGLGRQTWALGWAEAPVSRFPSFLWTQGQEPGAVEATPARRRGVQSGAREGKGAEGQRESSL